MKSGDYPEAQQHVNWVIKEIQKQLKATQNEYDRAHHQTRKVQKDYGTDTSVNYFEVDDRIETKAELQQQRWLVGQDMETENVIKKKLSTLKQLKGSPYFGRIDIQYPKSHHSYRLYIGTSSLVDNHEHFLVFDWRAPIASVYYNGTMGLVSYHTPAGKQTTKLTGKRQYLIKHGRIKNMFDTNEIVGDEMLQHVLGQKNDKVMHNIVATIQRDQNSIIRDTKNDLLVVQGVAGSGKTSAILQRIAFLLYHSRNSLNANQILLFSPNRLFSHYISDVLPSLGEHNMRQITWADFVSKRFEGLQVQTIFERYENDHNLSSQALKIRKFKNSRNFMDKIRGYCQHLTPKQMAFNPILFNGRIFFSKLTVRLLYASLPKAISITDKFLDVKNQLIIMLKNRINAEANRPAIQHRVDTLSSEEYNQFFTNPKIEKASSMNEERHLIARRLATNQLRRVYNAIFNDDFFDPYIQYRKFLEQVKIPSDITTKAWQRSIQRFDHELELHRLKLDNATPLLYLRDLLTGSGINHSIKYLFVDEMQDYSLAQLMYLKHAFPKAKLNLIGDSEQSLFKDVQSPNELLRNLNRALSFRNARLIRLNRSYRSTYPITNFAKALLPNGDKIQAFHRDGPVPKIIIRSDFKSALKATRKVISQQLERNGTVAIITKHASEAKILYQRLSNLTKVTLISDSDRSLPNGVVILPVYLAKGLEFDSVIAWNVSQNNYNHKRLLGVLYTIATRAMHALNLISIGPVSSLISKSNVGLEQFTVDQQL